MENLTLLKKKNILLTTLFITLEGKKKDWGNNEGSFFVKI